MDYTIQKGDNLGAIAKKYGTTVQDLAKANNIANPNLIQAGAKLAIPSISAEKISTTPISIPPVTPPTKDPNAFVTSFTSQLQPLQQQVDTATTTATNSQNDLINLQKQLEGKTAEQIKLEEQQGIPQINTELIGLQNEGQRLTTEYLNAIRNREAQGGVAAVVGADQKRIQSQAASDIGLLNAQIQAKSGQLELARGTVDRAIAIKYEPLIQSLETKKLIYEMNKDSLSRADQKLLEAKNKQWTLQLDQYKKEQEDEKDKNKLIIDASQFAPSSLLTKAKQAKTTLEAAQILGKYSGNYLENRVKQSQIDRNYTEMAKTKAEIKALDTPINTSNIPNTTVGFTTKLLATAKSSKNLEATERQNLAKAMTVIGQVDSLQSNIAKQNKTGFIKGKVNNFLASIGQNAEVGVINAQLQAIVPNLARGTYGEVGVLTDNDIKNYRATLPQLTAPKDQNDAVLALTLKTVKASIENQLRSATNSGLNTSGWAEDYSRISKQVYDIEDRIGVSRNAVNTLVASNPALLPAVKEMYDQGLRDGEILEALNAR